MLLIRPLGSNFSEILIEIYIFSFVMMLTVILSLSQCDKCVFIILERIPHITGQTQKRSTQREETNKQTKKCNNLTSFIKMCVWCRYIGGGGVDISIIAPYLFHDVNSVLDLLPLQIWVHVGQKYIQMWLPVSIGNNYRHPVPGGTICRGPPASRM